MHVVFLHSTVFFHHSITIWLAYIPACIHSHIGPLWEFSSPIIMMVQFPPPHNTTLSKPLLLLSPLGPDLALLALRPFQGVCPQGSYNSYTPSWCMHVWILWCLCVQFNALWPFSPLACIHKQLTAWTNLVSDHRNPLCALWDVPLGKSSRLGHQSDQGGECPVITLQYPWGMGLAH